MAEENPFFSEFKMTAGHLMLFCKNAANFRDDKITAFRLKIALMNVII